MEYIETIINYLTNNNNTHKRSRYDILNKCYLLKQKIHVMEIYISKVKIKKYNDIIYNIDNILNEIENKLLEILTKIRVKNNFIFFVIKCKKNEKKDEKKFLHQYAKKYKELKDDNKDKHLYDEFKKEYNKPPPLYEYINR